MKKGSLIREHNPICKSNAYQLPVSKQKVTATNSRKISQTQKQVSLRDLRKMGAHQNRSNELFQRSSYGQYQEPNIPNQARRQAKSKHLTNPNIRIPFYKEVQGRQELNMLDFGTIQKSYCSHSSSQNQLLAEQPAQINQNDSKDRRLNQQRMIQVESSILQCSALDCTFNPSKLQQQLKLARQQISHSNSKATMKRQTDNSRVLNSQSRIASNNRGKSSKDLTINTNYTELYRKEGSSKVLQRELQGAHRSFSNKSVIQPQSSKKESARKSHNQSIGNSKENSTKVSKKHQKSSFQIDNDRLRRKSNCQEEYEIALKQLRSRIVRFQLKQS